VTPVVTATPADTGTVREAITPAISSFVVLAERSARVQTGAVISSGAVGARATTTTGVLQAGFDLWVQKSVTLPGAAYGAWLGFDTSVHAGAVFSDHFTHGTGDVYGTVSAYAQPPALPAAPTITTGTTNVTVAANGTQTLAPGKYATVTVGKGGTLNLSGGTYQIATLSPSTSAKILAVAAVDVRVTNAFSLTLGQTIGPATGSGLTAKSVQLTSLSSATTAATLGSSTVRAVVYAPNGTLLLQSGLALTGAVGGKDVDVGASAKLTLEDGFAAPTCASCDDANACTTDACVNGVCTHTAVAAGTVCRASAGVCDVAEVCNGTSAACPVDAFSPASTVCRASAGACDVADTCTGTSAVCPADAFSPSTTVCRAAVGACDVAEKCTGSAAACPSDAKVASGTVCRPANGACDAPEVCDGASGACAGDAFVAAGVVCRAAAGSCDAPEVCSGASAVCPSDVLLASGTECRAAAGPCDVAESCSGASAACPTDVKIPIGTVCRAAAGPCDADERCNGVAATCPSDAFVAAGAVCRPAAGPCDLQETCTGVAATCPADASRPNGTACNDGNACTKSDTCQSGACVGASPVVCVAGDSCHVAGACEPSTGVCSNPAKADGSACNDGNGCTQLDTCQAGTCTGSSPVACAAIDACHGVGACDAITGVCSNPVLAPGSSCSDGNACNGLETCTAAGACLAGTPPTIDDGNPCTVDSCTPASGVSHVALGAGASCSDGNACNGLETCNVSGTCQSGPPPSLDDGNPCTVDSCDPSSGVSHVQSAAGASCSDGNACNGQETCDAAGACRPGVAPAVDDGNPCTTDGCDPALGVTHAPVQGGTPCGDAAPCAEPARCDGAGSCKPGGALVTSDNDPCTADSCDPVAGLLHLPIPGCDVGGSTWRSCSAGRPSPRDGAAVAFDPVAQAVVAFGGENAGVALADTWVFDSSSGRWRGGSIVGPSARSGAVATYDTARKKTLVFGGASSRVGPSYFADLWEYDAATGAWSKVADGGPTARLYASFAYDTQRRKAVLFGGTGASGDLGDTWEWDSVGQQWSQRVVSAAPSARSGAAAAFLQATGRVVLFGGASLSSAGVPMGDTWEWDGSVWNPVATSGPAARTGHAMAYDATRGRVVMNGGVGITPDAPLGTQEYDGHAWVDVAQAVKPESRTGHALVYDTDAQAMRLAFGLSYSSSGTSTPGGDVEWSYRGSSGVWTPTSHAAPARTRPGAAYDAARGHIVVAGALGDATTWEFDAVAQSWASQVPSDALPSGLGSGASFPPSATFFYSKTRGAVQFVEQNSPSTSTPPARWEWSGSAWSRRVCSGAFYSSGYSLGDGALVQGSGDIVYAIYPNGPNGHVAVWALDLAACSWAAVTVPGNAPSYRLGTIGAWDAARGVAVIFGGTELGTNAFLNETWEWNPSTVTWTRRLPTTPPPYRAAAALGFDPVRNVTLLFGGTLVQSTTTDLGDTWEYSGVAGQWTKRTSVHAPVPRSSGALVFEQNLQRLVLAGGVSARRGQADLWAWDGADWAQLGGSASPPARSGSAGGFEPNANSGVLFGGVAGDGGRALLADTWLWRGGQWGILPAQDAFGNVSPPPRAGHVFAVGYTDANWQPNLNGVLFGGEGEAGLLRDTWTWNGLDLVWKQTSNGKYGDPPARTGAAITTSAKGYLMFGGLGAAGPLGDLWEFDGGWASPYGGNKNPDPRWGHAIARDPSRHVVVMFGGKNASGLLTDTWELSEDLAGGNYYVWRQRHPSKSPPGSVGHALTYDATRGVVVLTGGTGSSSVGASGVTWEWLPDQNVWIERAPVIPMPGRAGHVAFHDPQVGIMVTGGLAYANGGNAAASFGDSWCFARGTDSDTSKPRYLDGLSCTTADDCLSGNCVDGVCCDSACSGVCAACNLPGHVGTCFPVQGAPVSPRAPCAASACSSGCNGSDMTACHPLSTDTVCAPTACVAGVVTTASTCDSSGACAPGTSVSCAPYRCDGVGCATECLGDQDCFSPEYYCIQAYQYCARLARITSFTAAPAPASVGTQVTLTATTNLAYQSLYRFSVSLAGVTTYPCGDYLNHGDCAWAPTAAGAYVAHVEVKTYDSKGVDDKQDLSVAVQP
jgi:hypothetical protein